jgi:hypothetical protein
MTSSLGALLLRSGLLTPVQHLTAAETAEEEGTSLATVLLRLGHLSEDRLVELCRTQLLVPVVARPTLLQALPDVVQLVPAALAERFLIVPFGLDAAGSLLIAMVDPTDTHAADEVAYQARRPVIKHVAADSAVRAAIARHYRGPGPVELPAPEGEEIILLTKVKGRPLPAPPPQLPAGAALRPAAARRPDPQPWSAPVRAEPETLPAALAATEVAEGRPKRETLTGIGVQDLPPPPRSPSGVYGQPAARPTPVSSSKITAPRLSTENVGHPTQPSPAALWSTTDAARATTFERTGPYREAEAALRRITDRDAVGTMLRRYFENHFWNTAFFVIRKSQIVGVEGGGSRLREAAVQQVSVPVDAPSLFREALSARLPRVGALSARPADLQLAATLGYRPEVVVLVPVLLRGKVVGLLYGDSPHQPLHEGELQDLLRDAEAAYERLILSQRGG